MYWTYLYMYTSTVRVCTWTHGHEHKYSPSEFALLSRMYSKIAVMGKIVKLSDHFLVIQFCFSEFYTDLVLYTISKIQQQHVCSLVRWYLYFCALRVLHCTESTQYTCRLQRRGERRATINEVFDGLRRLRIYVLERYMSLSEDTIIYAV